VSEPQKLEETPELRPKLRTRQTENKRLRARRRPQTKNKLTQERGLQGDGLEGSAATALGRLGIRKAKNTLKTTYIDNHIRPTDPTNLTGAK
jgi:hypothetical protein